MTPRSSATQYRLRKEAALKMYLAGKTVDEIATFFGRSTRQVRRMLEELADAGHISRRDPQRPNKILDSQIAELYWSLKLRRISMDEVTARLGVCKRTVEKRIADYERQHGGRPPYPEAASGS